LHKFVVTDEISDNSWDKFCQTVWMLTQNSSIFLFEDGNPIQF